MVVIVAFAAVVSTSRMRFRSDPIEQVSQSSAVALAIALRIANFSSCGFIPTQLCHFNATRSRPDRSSNAALRVQLRPARSPNRAPPDHLPPSEYQKNLGAFDCLTLRVRRQCSEDEGRNAALAEFQDLSILSDAARVFWLFFETIRETEFRENNKLSGYPVARAEEIQNNPLVRTCELASSYGGVSVRTIPLSSHAAI
jgi:hypothetical protein